MTATIIPSGTLDLTKNAPKTDPISHKKQVKSSLIYFNGFLLVLSSRTEGKPAFSNIKWSRAVFLTLGTNDILGQLIICYAVDYLVHCSIFSSIHGLYSLNAKAPPPSYDNQKCQQTLLHVPWRKKQPPAENHCSRERKEISKKERAEVVNMYIDRGRGLVGLREHQDK